MTEGVQASRDDLYIDLQLVGDIHVPADGIIVAATGAVRIPASSEEQTVRLPVWDGTVGGRWGILVKKSWAPYSYLTRVPSGSGPISLARLPVVSELTSLSDDPTGVGAQYQVVALPPGGKPGDALAVGTGGLVWQSIADSYDAQRMARWGFEGDLLDISPSGSRYFAFPTLTPLDDLTLMVTCADQSDHFGSAKDSVGKLAVLGREGQIIKPWVNIGSGKGPDAIIPIGAVVRDGKTYIACLQSEPYRMRMLVIDSSRRGVADLVANPTTTPIDFGVVSAGQSKDGAAFGTDLFWCDGWFWAAGYWAGGVWLTKSQDGISWTPVHKNIWQGWNETRYVVQGRRILATLRWQDEGSDGGSRGKIGVAWSEDAGATWSDPRPVLEYTGMPTTTLMPDGTVVLCMRDGRAGSSWTWAQSWDWGRTWTITDRMVVGAMMVGQVAPSPDQPDKALWVGGTQRLTSGSQSRIQARRMVRRPARVSEFAGTPELLHEMLGWRSYRAGLSVGGGALSYPAGITGRYRQIGTQTEVWVTISASTSVSGSDSETVQVSLPEEAPAISQFVCASGSKKIPAARWVSSTRATLLRWDGADARASDIGGGYAVNLRFWYEQRDPILDQGTRNLTI